MKRALSLLGLVGAALGLIAILASFPVEASYRGKAVLAQRVEKDAGAALFDGSDAYRPIGSPQPMIIEDPKAFLPEPTQDGVRQVDEAYLKDKGIYPLQLKTVEFFTGNARLGGGIALVLGWALYFLSRRGPTATRSQQSEA